MKRLSLVINQCLCGCKTGGESGIRTHVRVSPKHAFQACAFSHSAISPARMMRSSARRAREREVTAFITIVRSSMKTSNRRSELPPMSRNKEASSYKTRATSTLIFSVPTERGSQLRALSCLSNLLHSVVARGNSRIPFLRWRGAGLRASRCGAPRP